MPKNLHSADWTRHNLIIIFSNLTVKRIKMETSFTIQTKYKEQKKASRDKETWFKNVNIGKSISI